MTTMTQGTVTVTLPDTLEIPEKAGSMSRQEMQRVPKARHGVGAVCEATADAMLKNPDRLAPFNVDPARLASQGRMSEEIDNVVVDTEVILVKMKQAGTLIDAAAHEELRKVLAFVRGQEKFDPRVVDLVPHLIEYFSTTRNSKAAAE